MLVQPVAGGECDAVPLGHQGKGGVDIAQLHGFWGDGVGFQDPSGRLADTHLGLEENEAVILQMLQIDPGPGSAASFLCQQLVIAAPGGAEHDLFLGDQFVLVALFREAVRFRHGEEAQFNTACLQGMLQCGSVLFQDVQFIFREALLKQGQDLGQQGSGAPGRDADTQLAVGAFLEFFQLLLKILLQMDHFSGGLQIDLTGGGGNQLFFLPFKQGYTHIGFLLLQEPAQRRL